MKDGDVTPDPNQGVSSHPGWLGWGYGGGVLAMHADWPAYPCPPGGLHALFDLTQFPMGTRFDPIDDIDRCVLFVAYNYDAKKPEKPTDPLASTAFQVAIWHEDLLALQAEGLIRGVTPISEREWRLRQRLEFGLPWGRKIYTRNNDGTMVEGDWPALPEAPHPDDLAFGEDPYLFPAFEVDGVDSPVTVTDAGWEVARQQMASAVELPDDLPDLRKLLDAGLYDSAIREVGIAVESALRRVVGTQDGYGQKLVDQFIQHMGDSLFAYNTTLKAYRLRLRTFFKFVRNPHAHHKLNIPTEHALALTASALHLLAEIEGVHPAEDKRTNG